jgi:photosystem II stability/assembly factor-like uncharacterized protein
MTKSNNVQSLLFQALKWRCIGPPRGGRVVAVAGHPTKAAVFYFGGCAGGVWKTEDAGTYWQNISDGYFNSAAVGAIAVSEADPNVIYVGMGESSIRLDVSYGDGVYKSADGGKSWVHVGLADTHHIARIRIHPHNPDIVYAAALGHAFGPNQERGVFRSMDGGKSWQQILFRSDKAGAIDLALDVTNPRILYATIWETYRNFWSLSSGGPDSSIYKSSDGGDTWVELTNKPGLPEGIKGKIGIAVSPAKPERVWAIVEAEKRGLYGSEDGGQNWKLLSDNRDLLARPWYYCHIFADPQDPETVYVLNLKMWKSSDGGRNFTEITTPHGDNHDLWIDPRNPARMIQGNDGGACVSFNGGESWTTIYNQLTAQFYHVAVDNQYPYRVYGTQQDNSSISVPSATEKGAILWNDCYPAGTGESGYIAVHPQDPNIVYVGAVGSSPGGGGALQRYDHRTRQIRLVTVWPEIYYGWGAKDLKYRFPWTFPIVFSPHDPNILYTAGNLVFRSTDEGSSWEIISPDLTRNDESKLGPSGGPISLDTSGAEHYGTISTFVESPHEAGVFWAGSDDGLIHLSRDGGKSWQKLNLPDLPEWTLISLIEPSPHNPATAYVAATRYKLDDYRPYLYKTGDYGQSWQKISLTFPEREITRVIREDPARRGLLYVGTETGVYVSLDDGATWQRFQQNLPIVPVYDLVIKDHDLVAATHGRSFWILDDLTPLHQLADQAAELSTHLFKPRPTIRPWLLWSINTVRGSGKNYMMGLGGGVTFYEEKLPDGDKKRTFLDAGDNPPAGVIISYFLGEKPAEEITLTFLDADGNEIRTFSSKAKEEDKARENKSNATAPEERRIPAEAGLNRFVWDLRYPDAEKVPGDVLTETSVVGPVAAPGRYQVRLKAGDHTYTQSFELLKDPRVTATQAELEAQFELWRKIRDKVSETHQAINQLRRVRQQVKNWLEYLNKATTVKIEPGAITEAAEALQQKLSDVEKELIQTEAKSGADRLRLPARLNAKLIALTSILASADAAPPKQAYDVFEHLSAQVDENLAQLTSLLETDLEAFNMLIKEAGIPAVVV